MEDESIQDQVLQYLSTEYQQICFSHGLVISHSRKTNPLDNAVIESIYALFKKETLYNHDITSLKTYIQHVHEWMNYYNTFRPIKRKSRQFKKLSTLLLMKLLDLK